MPSSSESAHLKLGHSLDVSNPRGHLGFAHHVPAGADKLDQLLEEALHVAIVVKTMIMLRVRYFGAAPSALTTESVRLAASGSVALARAWPAALTWLVSSLLLRRGGVEPAGLGGADWRPARIRAPRHPGRRGYLQQRAEGRLSCRRGCCIPEFEIGATSNGVRGRRRRGLRGTRSSPCSSHDFEPEPARWRLRVGQLGELGAAAARRICPFRSSRRFRASRERWPPRFFWPPPGEILPPSLVQSSAEKPRLPS